MRPDNHDRRNGDDSSSIADVRKVIMIQRFTEAGNDGATGASAKASSDLEALRRGRRTLQRAELEVACLRLAKLSLESRFPWLLYWLV